MMKKIMSVGLAISFLSTAAFAQETWVSGAAGSATNLSGTALESFRTSKEVRLACTSGASSYAVVSDHLNGTRTFGSTAGDSLIYFQDKTTPGQHYNTALANSNSGQFSSWTSL